jgi:hypothetical protein
MRTKSRAADMATEALVAHVVVSKFCEPFRSIARRWRQGITLGRQTRSTRDAPVLAAALPRSSRSI